MDIAEGLHLVGTEEQLLEGIDIDLEHLGRAEDKLLAHPEEEHRGSLGQLGMQEAVEDSFLDIEHQDKVMPKGKPGDKVAWVVACMAILGDKLAIKGNHLDSLEEDTEVLVVEDKDILEHHQLEASADNLEDILEES